MIRSNSLATLLTAISVAFLAYGCGDQASSVGAQSVPNTPSSAESGSPPIPLVLVPQVKVEASLKPPIKLVAEAFAYHRVLKSGVSQENFLLAYQNMQAASKSAPVACFAGEAEREVYCEQNLDGAMVRGNFYRTQDDQWSNIGVEVL